MNAILSGGVYHGERVHIDALVRTLRRLWGRRRWRYLYSGRTDALSGAAIFVYAPLRPKDKA